jgi:hypothetical protein
VAVSRWVWRGVFLVLAAVWAWLMLVVGMLLLAEWSDWTGPSVWLGVAVIAVGQFIAAVAADLIFPRASRKLSATVEIAAWAVFVGAIAAWLTR